LNTPNKQYIINKKGIDYMKGSCHYDKKAKRWFVQIYWEGLKHRFWKHPQTGEPFWARKSANKQLNRIRTEVDEGYFNPKFWKPDSPMSVAIYATEWLEIISVSRKTHSDYKTSVNKYIIPFLGNKDIRAIRHADLVKFYRWIKRSAKGKYNVMSTLRTMLRFAWRNEDIQSVPPFPILTYELPEIDYLEFDQQEKVLAKIPLSDRPIFYFMQEYGVRPGEARGLCKDCIVNRQVVIRRTFSENILNETTKTKNVRHYDITPFFHTVLDSIPRQLSKFVFVRKDGKPYTSKNLNKIWHDASSKVGIKIKMYNAFRHSLGCQLLDQGEDLDLVRQQLGHTKSEMTRRYAKRSVSRLTEALNRRRQKIIPVGKDHFAR